ncbi:MAG: class I SAM-dependent methyltransferase [Anaerolineales bacterium]|jgi:SAM-dependent methyltransferase
MTIDFYDQLAPFYHLLHEDWEADIASQADFLSDLIENEWGPSVESVLDISCGIGTQSIALAKCGYQVTASDLSPETVARAQREAQARDLLISFSVCDMRALYDHHGSGFDLVICAGNAIPHLLSDEEILLALREMRACLRSGGGCILTIRQYDQEVRGKGILKPFGVRQEGEKRYVIFQVWDFEGEQYDFSMYFIEDDMESGEVETHIMRSRYYAISPNHLLELMEAAGFEDVKRLDGGISHGAVLVGTKRTSIV